MAIYEKWGSPPKGYKILDRDIEIYNKHIQCKVKDILDEQYIRQVGDIIIIPLLHYVLEEIEKV